ncbi:MAG: M56 family metallopeptidase [Thermoanaerobaculia bacterium]|nr:M56 family metallopeptidase [Thermoanaerobaculia bacterium]
MNPFTDWLPFLETAGAWLSTYLLHSSVLLVPTLLLTRLLRSRHLALQESLLRIAVVGGLLTASLQAGLGWESAAGTIAYPASSAPPATISETTVEMPFVATGEARAASSRRSESAASLPVPTSDRVAAVSEQIPWLALAVLVWGIGAALLGARLVLLAVSLSRRLRYRTDIERGSLFRLFWRLLASADVDRRTRLTRSGRLTVPIAFGLVRREICLLDRVVDELPHDQQGTVLAHELAHLERRDPLQLLIVRLIESVFFVQPLNRLARRRLQEVAEYRCDDWAARHTGRPDTLARCLTEVASWSVGEARLGLAPTMAGRSGLGRRVRRLLAPGYAGIDTRVPGWSRPLAGAALIAVIVAVPGFTVLGQEPAPPPPTPESPELDRAVVEPQPVEAPAEPEPSVSKAVVAPVVPVARPAAVSVAPVSVAPLPVASPSASPRPLPRPAPALEPRESVVESGESVVVPDEEDVAPVRDVRLAPRIVDRVDQQRIVRLAPEVVVRTSAAGQVDRNEDREVERETVLSEEEMELLEEEIEQALESLEETLEGDLEGALEGLEDELDRIEETLERNLELELERFERSIENEVELMESDLEWLEEELERDLDRRGERPSEAEAEALERRREVLEDELERIEEAIDEVADDLDDALDRIEDRLDDRLERRLDSGVERQLEARIEAMTERLDIESERLEALARELARRHAAEGRAHLTPEDRDRLRAEARRIATEARPSEEELEALRSSVRELEESLRPTPAELEQLRRQLAEELEAVEVQVREALAAQRRAVDALREESREP